jgi:hypothetical protein
MIQAGRIIALGQGITLANLVRCSETLAAGAHSHSRSELLAKRQKVMPRDNA